MEPLHLADARKSSDYVFVAVYKDAPSSVSGEDSSWSSHLKGRNECVVVDSALVI